MKRVALAFILGVFAFPVVMYLGEALGLTAGFVSLAVYFFICQVLLSRGNPHALREDWRIMLALNAIMLCAVVIMSLVENRETVLSQGPGILLGSWGGTLAGGLTASWAARRTSAKR